MENVKEEKKEQTEKEEKGEGGEEKEYELKEERGELEELDEEKGERYTFNFTLKLHKLSFLALPLALLFSSSSSFFSLRGGAVSESKTRERRYKTLNPFLSLLGMRRAHPKRMQLRKGLK